MYEEFLEVGVSGFILKFCYFFRSIFFGNNIQSLINLFKIFLQILKREILCKRSLIGHTLDAPIPIFLNEGITCPKPVSTALFVDCSSLRQFWQRVAKWRLIHVD